METLTDNSRTVCEFGPFRWIPQQRALFKGETLLPLGSRARGILSVLIERAGELVKCSELIARVWGGVIVEDGTLRSHIAQLRKALECEKLGSCCIETVNGLGYRFIGHGEGGAAPVEPPPTTLETCGSQPSSRMIGREDIVSILLQRLREKRLLTLVGTGGIGKTTIANLAMTLLREDYADGAHFVDLSTITDEQHITTTLIDALNVTTSASGPMQALLDHITGRHMLVVLDNCEHVIDAVAPLAEMLLLQAKDLRILATSREPLRVRGESVLRLPPLDVPPRMHAPGAQNVLKYSAVRLFVEQATANDHTFELTDVDAPIAAEICRRLDGLPLAIELAAAQVGLFGIRGLAAHLDELLDLLTQGRRTAPPRHRSLRATLQWSFNLLSDTERRALRRLSTMADGFDLMAARTVVAHDGIGENDVLDIVSRLTAKSLIVSDHRDTGMFRLFQTTRSFALSEIHS